MSSKWFVGYPSVCVIPLYSGNLYYVYADPNERTFAFVREIDRPALRQMPDKSFFNIVSVNVCIALQNADNTFVVANIDKR